MSHEHRWLILAGLYLTGRYRNNKWVLLADLGCQWCGATQPETELSVPDYRSRSQREGAITLRGWRWPSKQDIQEFRYQRRRRRSESLDIAVTV